MKRLWKVLPPCFSDLMGFEAVMNETEGLGLIDDSSTYKPLMFGRGGHGRPGIDGRPGGGPSGMDDRSEMDRRTGRDGRPGMDDGADPNGRPWAVDRSDRGRYAEITGRRERGGRLEMNGRHGHGHGGGRGGFGGIIPGMRVLNSDIRNEDIISGTEKKVMLAFEKGEKQLSPNFVLLAYGPSASMIGSDLEYAAGKISAQSGLPAAYVKIEGEKDYLYGISCTLEAMGRLLLSPRQTLPDSLNILGANTIDWPKEAFTDLETLLVQEEVQILSRWGWKETTENLKMASAAALNLVVNESGLRLARYMECEFGIPYLAGAPFGAASVEMIKNRLKEAGLGTSVGGPEEGLIKKTESAAATGKPDEYQTKESGSSTAAGKPDEDLIKGNAMDTEPEILIVGEQFTANAIRRELLHRGKKGIRVLSFYDMDKAYMETGDRKLTGEDDFAGQASAASVRMILADGDLHPLVKKEVRWVKIPNTGSMFPVESMDAFNMTGGALDAWLNREGL